MKKGLIVPKSFIKEIFIKNKVSSDYISYREKGRKKGRKVFIMMNNPASINIDALINKFPELNDEKVYIHKFHRGSLYKDLDKIFSLVFFKEYTFIFCDLKEEKYYILWDIETFTDAYENNNLEQRIILTEV